MIAVAYQVNKRYELRVQTMYAWERKGNLAPTIDEQASINTPKAIRGTAPNLSIANMSEKNNPEEKFALKDVDSDGNELTDQQAEYFK